MIKAALALLALVLVQQQAAPPPPLAALSGVGAALSGAAAAPSARQPLEVPSGATVMAASAGADLALRRGGQIHLCGPARLGLNRGGDNALLLSLQSGAVNLRYAAAVTDAVLTPDFRLSTVVPPGQIATVSANLALAPGGAFCIANHGSALSLVRLGDGSQQYLVAGETIEIQPAGTQKEVPACACAAAAPAPVPATSASDAAAGPLFPHQPALTVNGAAGPPAPPASTAASPRPPRSHRNAFSRFFHWLFG